MADKRENAPMLDPIAYRSDYKPEDINPEFRGDNGLPGVGPLNANENYQEYGDDSNPSWQGQKGGLNPKYEGEGVANTYVDYNPNLRTGDLDPNYLYGDAARQQNAKEMGYIGKRNDMIASALYNEGKVSRQDVADYMAGQKGWFDSTEADRQNTIESIWKRLGQISPDKQGDKGNVDESKADSINNPDKREGELYGKNSADSTNPEEGIKTLADANSPYAMMEEARAANLKTLISMPPANIAIALDKGLLPADLQSIRDMQQYYPELWDEVKQYQKKTKTQDVVNSISNGDEIDTSNNGQSVINNSIVDFANDNASLIKSSQDISKDVRDSLASNQTASEASETMADIENDMAQLKNRLKNLKLEASKVFKGDVPDYLVKAYISNKTQEIQNQMQILEDRYNMAMDRYKTEVANTQWEKEFELKKEELQLKRDSLSLEEYKVKNGISTTKTSDSKSKTNSGDKYAVTTLTDKEVADAVDYLYQLFDNGQLGNAQCAAGIQKYYLPMLGISLSNLSSLENKKALINEGGDYVPKKGDLIIIDSGAKLEDGTPAGHIGIVLNVLKDGTIEYMDWNHDSDEKVSISGISKNSKALLGFRNVNKKSSGPSSDQEWTDYDYVRFEQYRDSTSKSEKETIAAEYGTDVEGMNNIVRDALTNREKTIDIPDYSNTEWTDIDYDNFSNFLNSNNKDISNTDRESIAEMYGFKGNLPGMREFARTQLANRPEVEEPDGSVRFKKYENGFNPSLVQYFENFGTTKMSDPQFKSMLKTERLTEEEFGQQRDNYFNYKQVEFDEAGLEILNKIADFQIAMDDMGKIKNGVFDKNWLWNSWFGGGPAKATFDAMTNEQLLNKYVQARSSGVTFGSTTEAEWDIMKATNALEKTTGFLSSDKDFTNAYKSYLHGVWEQTMKKPFSNEEWDSFWMTRKMNRDSMEINSSDSEKNRRKEFEDAADGIDTSDDDAENWMND